MGGGLLSTIDIQFVLSSYFLFFFEPYIVQKTGVGEN